MKPLDCFVVTPSLDREPLLPNRPGEAIKRYTKPENCSIGVVRRIRRSYWTEVQQENRLRIFKMFDRVKCVSLNVERYLLDCRSFIDNALGEYLKNNGRDTSVLHQAICYSVLDGGKRFRPILTLATGELFGAKRRELLPFACAIELIHCYSLIHDDLPALDNDDLRRGKLSCHKRFGEAIALLAGDALLTEAFFIMSDPKAARLLGVPLISKLIREVSDAASIRGMIGGQSTELELAKRKVTPAVLEDLDHLKTGALITAAARVGAIIGGAAGKDLARVTRYGRALGLAFQITDDILDSHEVSSDKNGSKGMVNYLSVAEPAEARERVKNLLSECLRAMRPYGGAAEPLLDLARYVAQRTLDAADETVRAIGSSGPEQRLNAALDRRQP